MAAVVWVVGVASSAATTLWFYKKELLDATAI